MTKKRPSRAAVQRATAQAVARATQVPVLSTKAKEILDRYRPTSLSEETWAAVAPVHRHILERCGMGDESIRKRCHELARYLAFRSEQGLSLQVIDALDFGAIDDYYARGMADYELRSRNDLRSRLRSLAKAVNPSGAPAGVIPLGHQVAKPGYSRKEETAIKRTALHQRRPVPRRNMCVIVGFSGGAGLDSTEIKLLRPHHVFDLGQDGIRVDVPGKRARSVMVRRDYEAIVRMAVANRKPNELLAGSEGSAHNICAAIVERAEIFGDVPHIEVSRLRSTWLTWLLLQRVPLNVILQAAGLQSARTLCELISQLPETTLPLHILRGGGQ
ncbi:MAG TPA: hypothetical protein VHV57_12235 [Acidimicrobiales bacterium]|jgi:hypothetical protein|nr:hypothetical protein [Acidimicrobiales bacterium]